MRYAKIFSLDVMSVEVDKVNIIDKLSFCSQTLVGNLNTCSQVTTINLVWWIVIGLLAGVSLYLVINKLFFK